jgi:hypothetical protein
MTILWAGGEDIDFIGTFTLTTNAGHFRPDYARHAIDLTSGGGRYLRSANPVDPFSSAWLSAQVRLSSMNSSTTSQIGIGFYNSSTGSWIGIGNDASVAGKINIVKWNGTTRTRLAAESGTSILNTNFYKIDLQVIDYGANGTLKVYINRVLAVEYTGDISSNSDTTLDSIYFTSTSATGFGASSSEIIVADEDTRLVSLKTLAPDAAGDINEWTGDYTAIDEVTLSDADVIHTDQFDKNFQCNLTGMPTGDFIVKAVKTSTRAADGIGGIGLKSGIKTNAAEHEPGVHLGSTVELDGSWQLIEELYQQNPITSNRFTPAEIDALQLAYQSVEIV